MTWKHIFAKKDLEMLLAEMAGEHRLHRVLGPVALTSLGVGCIIGAGIFVMTGVAAADYAGPGVVISFAIAGLGCALAALCYAEFAAMAPVAGSAYTYAYTTMGEIFAWIIGWDLILEYAMGCATVASAWSGYLNEFLLVFSSKLQIPKQLLSDPFTHVEGLAGRPWFNMPSLLIMAVVTTILVVGIRESARTNAVLVFIKLSVVLFVVAVGWAYIQPENWHSVPYSMRVLPEEREMPKIVKSYLENEIKANTDIDDQISTNRLDQLHKELRAAYRTQWAEHEAGRLLSEGRISADAAKDMAAEVIANVKAQLPKSAEDKEIIEKLLPQVGQAASHKSAESWGILGWLGLNRWLLPIDDATRTPVYAIRPVRAYARRIHSIFRLHRFRFNFHPCRRSSPPAARRAHRHPCFPAFMHGVIHGGGRSYYGYDALSRYRYKSAHCRGFSLQGRGHSKSHSPCIHGIGCRRRFGGHDQRITGAFSKPGKNSDGHGPRWPVA